ncbi:MAG: asparagine synthase (glutamine-hydrolyzing) [Alphaproteobacteria bacterium]|nr:asparagine synthase (glutamine-hydrolyzing) [Alphaproteobacteria bacterium]
MCGIAGFYALDETIETEPVVQRMVAAIATRGPDGTKVNQRGRVSLGHRRLAVIDLTTGDQPIYNADNTAVVANAEIYNYIELKQEPECADYPYLTQSDCEVILPLHARHGDKFAGKLRGMFAICVFDPRSGMLTLARDRFGMKPLYYMETAQGILFASEIKALLAAGIVTPGIDRDQVQSFMAYHFTLGRNTVFDGVCRLLPGETLVLRDGRIVDRHTRPMVSQEAPRSLSQDAALDQLDTVLRDSIAVHCRSDVPIGLFLSGGVDSSCLLSVLAQDYRERLTTYTIGFPGTAVSDERELAARLSRLAGADHVEVPYSADDFWESLPKIARYFDDPLIDPAILPTWKLARIAGKDLKVVLSGEGSDEIFAGYGRYRRPWLRKFKRMMGRLSNIGGTPQAEIALSPAYTDLQRLQARDMVDWLPHGLLGKLDKCLMAHGLEGRTPFLDTAVADFGFRLPDHLKIQGQDGKWLLKTWLQRRMPDAMPFAHKRGFTVPVGEWIASKSTDLADLMTRQPGIREYFRTDTVQSAFANPSGKLGFLAWSFLFFALWHYAYGLSRPTSDGTVFDILADAVRG